MGSLTWQEVRRWLFGVTVVTAMAVGCPRPAAAFDAVPVSLDSLRLSSVPLPPAPPPSPLQGPRLETPWESAGSADPAGPEPAEPPFVPLGPGIEMPSAGSLPVPPSLVPPGVPVPSYAVVINAPVEALIDYFVAKERDRFGMWIARSGRYLPMIQRIFRERGLPEELAYTAMIESGFSPRAVSRVGAKGMWQFMEATGRRYGLVINRWVDERLDPVKSTIAAAQYLGDLYGMFGHWFLAQAGYNAGEGRVAQAIQRARTSDFWALTQTRHLPEETKLFVPQILAATVITREPSRYGFDVTLESPLVYDEVAIKRPLDFETIARLAEIEIDQVREFNPSLLARITPPFGGYTLRLPSGTGARFEAALHAATPASLPAWTVHRLTRNQSLVEIARLYRVTTQRLAELNHLPGGRLRGIRELVVPVATAPASPAVAGASAPAPEHREIVVRRGDTLWGLAARYRLKPQTLAQLNGLSLDDPLIAGTRLRLVAP